MLNLLDVNTLSGMAIEYGKSANSEKIKELKDLIESKMADRKEVLATLERKAEEGGSDRAWNRYETADESYGYGEQLIGLLGDLESGDEWEDIEWQLTDLAESTVREWNYRMERAQW